MRSLGSARRLAWLVVVALVAVGTGCDLDGRKAAESYARAAWEGPCADVSSLLATTAGSPDSLRCPNRLHRIEVQPATLAGEEVAALVTCRCARPVNQDGGR